MDQNQETLNPVYSSMIAQTHQYFNPFNGYEGSAVNFWPQMLFSDQESEYASRIECQPLKRPRISNTTMKTKMVEQCLQFKRGYCTYGQNCQFAHDRESYVIKNWDEDDRIISKMKLCRRFCNGDLCPYGQRCHFLHEAPGKFRKGLAMNNGNTGPGGFYANGCEELGGRAFEHLNVNANQVYQKIDFRKTRLCNKWEATGNCPFGVKCNFAHGQAELQKLGSQIGTRCEIISTSKLTSAAATHASHCGTENQSSCDQEMMGEECLFKWKSFKKLNGIYADWIDEMPLVYSSLGKVGN